MIPGGSFPPVPRLPGRRGLAGLLSLAKSYGFEVGANLEPAGDVLLSALRRHPDQRMKDLARQLERERAQPAAAEHLRAAGEQLRRAIAELELAARGLEEPTRSAARSAAADVQGLSRRVGRILTVTTTETRR